MAQVNISQASRLAGKSRTTIHRKLKNGELSINNGLIDSSDLLRVFGTLVTSDGTVPPSVQRVTDEQITVQHSVQLEVLQAKFEALQRELSLKDEIIEEKDKRLALLEHKPNMSENLPPNSPPDTGSVYSENTDKDFKRERKKEGRLIKLGRFLFDE